MKKWEPQMHDLSSLNVKALAFWKSVDNFRFISATVNLLDIYLSPFMQPHDNRKKIFLLYLFSFSMKSFWSLRGKLLTILQSLACERVFMTYFNIAYFIPQNDTSILNLSYTNYMLYIYVTIQFSIYDRTAKKSCLY